MAATYLIFVVIGAGLTAIVLSGLGNGFLGFNLAFAGSTGAEFSGYGHHKTPLILIQQLIINLKESGWALPTLIIFHRHISLVNLAGAFCLYLSHLTYPTTPESLKTFVLAGLGG